MDPPTPAMMREDLNEQLVAAANDAAVALLEGPRLSAAIAAQGLPPSPGLYAIFTNRATHEGLGLPARDVRVPIYVGKAEDSLLKRDGQSHFREGKTGQSTLRRSLASLLRDQLGLVARPRNPAKPNHFDRFDMEPLASASFSAGSTTDSRSPPGSSHRVSCSLTSSVRCSESGHRRSIGPTTPGRWPRLREARRVMADDARRWAREPH